jgi:predicted transcriptional regulator
MTQEKRRVTFKVFTLDDDPDIIAQLEQIARAEDRTLSQVFRQAFRFFLANRPFNGTDSRDGQAVEPAEATA